MSSKRSGLGKGLDAIFSDNDIDSKSVSTLRISEIEPNRSQPRSDFDEEALAELADSISQHGVLQPLLVRPLTEGGYQIVAGERRWRASRMAGIKEVPVVIKDLSDIEVMELALIENLQREDLSPIEEAKGYRALMDTYKFTQEQVSKSVGKSRSVVANSLRLLSLPDSVLKMVSENKISSGHARTLLSLNNKENIEKVAQTVVEKDLSVRELEKLCKQINEPKAAKKNIQKRLPFFDEIEICLKEELGRKIKVKTYGSKKKKGVVEIEFYNENDLADIASRLAGTNY